jgi:hypothetical protein
MFRMVLPPTIRSAYNSTYSIWYLSHRYCYLPLSWKSWNWFECAKEFNTLHGQNAGNRNIKADGTYYKIYRIFRQIKRTYCITRTPNVFDIPFDVKITRMKLTSGRVRKYRPLLTEDTGVIPKKCLAGSSDFLYG